MQSDNFFSDAEVDDMCAGLVQDAAKIRYLERLGLQVHRKKNGRPLVWRPGRGPGQPEQGQNGRPSDQLNVVALQQWAGGRKGRNGQKTQRR